MRPTELINFNRLSICDVDVKIHTADALVNGPPTASCVVGVHIVELWTDGAASWYANGVAFW